MDVVVPCLRLPVVFHAICEAGVDLAGDFLDGALGGMLVGKVEGGSVDEGESKDVRL
jgi:hypothetical protein